MANAKLKNKAPKLRLYVVYRYYAFPATVYAVAPDKEEALKMCQDKYGKAESKAKRISTKTPRLLLP